MSTQSNKTPEEFMNTPNPHRLACEIAALGNPRRTLAALEQILQLAVENKKDGAA